MGPLASILLILFALIAQGCATPMSLPIVPASLANEAQVPDMAGVRVWGDGDGDDVTKAVIKTELDVLRAKFGTRSKAVQQNVSHILAISGGADDGAFAAGLLVGWGARGDRPSFDIVTGISAGSLIAPFVFIGKEYEEALSSIFIKYSGEDIYQANVVEGLFGGAAIADNAPLARLIAKYVDRKLLVRVAEERAKGRYLLVGTTNLNAQRPVFWDMGKIAQGNSAASLELFRKVLLASAALPGIFPPVAMQVKADGKTYFEEHVDGGPTRQVFLSPAGLSFRDVDSAVGYKVKRKLWIIRNGKLTPEYAVGGTSALSIAARSLETLTKSQGIGDLTRMWEKAKAEGIDYNLASIPDDFSHPRPAPFAHAYMKAVYTRGYELGSAGYKWAKEPPGVIGTANR